MTDPLKPADQARMTAAMDAISPLVRQALEEPEPAGRMVALMALLNATSKDVYERMALDLYLVNIIAMADQTAVRSALQ